MKIISIGIFALVVAAAVASAETIRLAASEGILIPAPVAHTLRLARGAYGGGGASYAAPASAPAAPSYSAPSAQAYSAPSAPAHTSIPAPPCATNYLFSCQPSLSPAPCSPSSAPASYAAPSSSYGAPSAPSSYLGSTHMTQQAAYSNPVPQYLVPLVKELY